ncbi:hypothetical protein D3C85_1494150 [compost metagenome]
MQCGNLVVEGFATLVEAPAAVAEQVQQQLAADGAAVLGQIRGVLQKVQQAPAIAIGGGQENLETFFRQAELPFAEAFWISQGTGRQLAQRLFIEAFQDIDSGSRKQRVI